MDKEQLTKFLKPGYYFLGISAVALIFSGLEAFTLLTSEQISSRNVLALIIGLVACVWTFWSFYTETKRFRRLMQELEQRGEMKRLTREFSIAKDFGTLRLGEKHAFVAKRGAPIRYKEISRVYLTNKNSLTRSAYVLEAVLTNGKTVELCSAKRKDAAGGAMLAQAAEFIQSKNSSIEGHK